MEQLIIVAIDHSAQSANAVQFYLNKLHRPGNKLMLVHCIELPSVDNARECHMSPGVLASLWKEEEAKSKILEEKMKILLRDKNQVSAKLRNCRGKPGETICRIAEEEKASLIVTGCRGMGTLVTIRRTILGSVSDYLLKHAFCPVIVCRDPADIERQRHSSGESNRSRHSSEKMPSKLEKSRHPSGEHFASFANHLRQRFASGGRSGSRFQSLSLDEETKEALMKFERTIVLYPTSEEAAG